jgi:hypothetical protein
VLPPPGLVCLFGEKGVQAWLWSSMRSYSAKHIATCLLPNRIILLHITCRGSSTSTNSLPPRSHHHFPRGQSDGPERIFFFFLNARLLAGASARWAACVRACVVSCVTRPRANHSHQKREEDPFDCYCYLPYYY